MGLLSFVVIERGWCHLMINYSEWLQKKLDETRKDQIEKLSSDLEKYQTIEECSDADFKEMQDVNRFLVNENERLKAEIDELRKHFTGV